MISGPSPRGGPPWLAGRFSREAVVNAEDVALAVLEPGRLAHARHRRDVVVPVDTGHVVVLEGHTLALQVGYGAVHVVDVPLSDGVAGLSGVLRLVDAESRTPCRAVHQHDAFDLLRGRDAKFVGVARASPGEVGGRDVGGDGSLLQHGSSLLGRLADSAPGTARLPDC